MRSGDARSNMFAKTNGVAPACFMHGSPTYVDEFSVMLEIMDAPALRPEGADLEIAFSESNALF